MGRIFLNLAVGAAYAPLSLSSDGLIYAQNNGHLFVLGNPFGLSRRSREARELPGRSSRVDATVWERCCGVPRISLELPVPVRRPEMPR